MWRRDNYEEEWERRKAYLIRSLFQDVPVLSPVPEEEESIDSLRSGILPSSTVARPTEYSPLPLLIIEKEPINYKHDESKEFYVKLEKKIMKIYRRMFIEDCSDVSYVSDSTDMSMSDSQYCNSDRRASFGEGFHDKSIYHNDDITINKILNHDQVENENGPDTKNTLKFSSSSAKFKECTWNTSEDTHIQTEKSSSSDILPKSTTDDMEIDEDLSSGDTQRTFEHNKYDTQVKNKTETDTRRRSDKAYREITFKADVHRDGTEEVVQPVPRLIYELNDAEEKNIANDVIYKLNEDLEKNDVSDIRNQNNSYHECDVQTIEVMRTPKTYPSADFFQNNDDTDINDDNDVRLKSESSEAHTECNSSKETLHNNMVFEESIDDVILQTSINNEGDRSNENIDPKNISTRKRKCSSSLSSSKRMRYEDVSVQTNCEEGDPNRRILFENIFVGFPSVFRLCGCVNHFCCY